MPSHIIHDKGKRHTKVGLARSALTKLGVVVTDGMIELNSKTPLNSGDTWKRIASESEIVDLHRHGLDEKGRNALREWLRKRGYKSIGNCKFQKPESSPDDDQTL